jgi:hypothetical protein
MPDQAIIEAIIFLLDERSLHQKDLADLLRATRARRRQRGRASTQPFLSLSELCFRRFPSAVVRKQKNIGRADRKERTQRTRPLMFPV